MQDRTRMKGKVLGPVNKGRVRICEQITDCQKESCRCRKRKRTKRQPDEVRPMTNQEGRPRGTAAQLLLGLESSLLRASLWASTWPANGEETRPERGSKGNGGGCGIPPVSAGGPYNVGQAEMRGGAEVTRMEAMETGSWLEWAGKIPKQDPGIYWPAGPGRRGAAETLSSPKESTESSKQCLFLILRNLKLANLHR